MWGWEQGKQPCCSGVLVHLEPFAHVQVSLQKRRKIKPKYELFKKVLPTINHALQDIQHMCGPCLNYNKHLTLLIAWHIYCHKITVLYKRIFKTTAFQYKPSLVLESQDQINKSTWFPFSMQQALSSPKSKTRAACQWCSSEVGGSQRAVAAQGKNRLSLRVQNPSKEPERWKDWCHLPHRRWANHNYKMATLLTQGKLAWKHCSLLLAILNLLNIHIRRESTKEVCFICTSQVQSLKTNRLIFGIKH